MISRYPGEFRYNKRRRASRIGIIVLSVIVAIIVCLTAAFFVKKKNAALKITEKYLASADADVVLYTYDEYERRLFPMEETVQRGTIVTSTGEQYTENGVTYDVIEYNGETCYISSPTSLTDDPENIATETEKWIRTSVTVYKNNEDSQIESFLKKGTHVDILGYDYLNDDGSANMYQIQAGDITGWVYAKYLVNSETEACAAYESILSIHEEYTYGSDLYGGTASSLDWYPVEKVSFEDNVMPDDVRGMYLYAGALANIDEYLEIAKENGVNAIILDVKDENLICRFDTAEEYSPTSNEYCWYSEETVLAAVQKIKDGGFYLICRIVVFNDEYYAQDNPDEAIESDSATQLWPSAYSRACWQYNILLAEECIEKFGCNEIQFDYVRFPAESYIMSTDESTDFKNTYNEEKAEAIQNFVFYACDQIHKYGVYVSIDVFAECANKYISSYGQYYPAISNICDAISAMPYTDHFGTTVDTWSDPYSTILEWATLAADRQSEIETPAQARTWLTGYSVPYWNVTVKCDEEYVTEEASALYDAGLTGGFMIWNAASSLSFYESYAAAWSYDY